MTLDLKAKQNLDDIAKKSDEAGDKDSSSMIDSPNQTDGKVNSVADSAKLDQTGDRDCAVADSSKLDQKGDKDDVTTELDQAGDKDGTITDLAEPYQTGDKESATTGSAELDQSSDRNSASIEPSKHKHKEKPDVKSKPNIPEKQIERKVTEENTELDFDEIVAKAGMIENVSERPKPAPRKKPVKKDRPNIPKRPEIAKDKPHVPVRPEGDINKPPSTPKRPEIVKDKPNVPKRPEIVKDKPNVPKRPEIIKEKPDVPKRPNVVSEPKQDDKPIVIAESLSDKTEEIETIKEDDILKYIQENTTNEDDVDLFS